MASTSAYVPGLVAEPGVVMNATRAASGELRVGVNGGQYASEICNVSGCVPEEAIVAAELSRTFDEHPDGGLVLRDTVMCTYHHLVVPGMQLCIEPMGNPNDSNLVRIYPDTRFACTGTRNLDADGTQAIHDLFERSFGPAA